MNKILNFWLIVFLSFATGMLFLRELLTPSAAYITLFLIDICLIGFNVWIFFEGNRPSNED